MGVGVLLLGTAAACDGGESEQPSFGAIVELASPAAPSSEEPNLTLGPDGKVYLTWIEPAADSADALRFAVLEGDEWSTPQTIAQGRGWFVNWADFPSLVVLRKGDLVAHYLQRDTLLPQTYNYGVRIVRSRDGGRTWSEAVVPHRDGAPAEHGFATLFEIEGDSVGAVWLDGRKADPRFGGTPEMTLRFTTLASDGTLGEDRAVDERVCDCCQTSVAQTSRGPLVVYRDRSDEEIRDIYVIRLLDGVWTTPAPVHRDGWHINACPVNGPATSADGDRVAVAWFTAAGDSARALVAFSDNAGETFDAPIRVDTGDPEGRVDVELLADGRALVSWLERGEGQEARVMARTVAQDGVLGEPTTVAASSAQRASGFPRMVRSGDSVVFAWTQPGEGSPSQVHVARARVGGE